MNAKVWCQDLFRFHQWRQEMITEMLLEVDAQLYNKELSGSFGSLYIILKHLVWAEKVWLGRVDENVVANMRDLDVPGLLGEWKQSTNAWIKFVNEKDPDNFQTPIQYYNTKGTVLENRFFEIVIHLIDHSTYHIGQLMNAIRGFGIDPVSTNYIHYLRAGNS